MRSWKLGLVGAEFVLLLLCFSNVAVARISLGLSIGTSFGHRYPGSYYSCYPYYSSHSGYYTWLDRDRYGWLDTGRYGHFPRHHYWPRRSRSSGLGIGIGDYYPMVVHTPIVVGVKARSEAADMAKNAAADAQLREMIQRKKSEQLKILNIGDKEKRIQAIHDLTAFSSDNEVRQALEDILLSDPDPEVRKEVAVSFGKTENRLVLAALTEAKEKDPVRNVRQAAYKAIIMIKGY